MPEPVSNTGDPDKAEGAVGQPKVHVLIAHEPDSTLDGVERQEVPDADQVSGANWEWLPFSHSLVSVGWGGRRKSPASLSYTSEVPASSSRSG